MRPLLGASSGTLTVGGRFDVAAGHLVLLAGDATEATRFRIVDRRQPAGGVRRRVACPRCDRVVWILYAPRARGPWACRRCHGADEASTRESHYQRSERRAYRARAKLGVRHLADPIPERPAGMRWATYLRLVAAIDAADLDRLRRIVAASRFLDGVHMDSP